jgi:hypothetical protein
MADKPDPTKDPEFNRVLGNLLRLPPKPHSEMKVGKRRKRNLGKVETKPTKAKRKT